MALAVQLPSRPKLSVRLTLKKIIQLKHLHIICKIGFAPERLRAIECRKGMALQQQRKHFAKHWILHNFCRFFNHKIFSCYEIPKIVSPPSHALQEMDPVLLAKYLLARSGVRHPAVRHQQPRNRSRRSILDFFKSISFNAIF